MGRDHRPREHGQAESAPAGTARHRCWQQLQTCQGTVSVENPANPKAPHGNEVLIGQEGIIFLKDRKEIRAVKKGI